MMKDFMHSIQNKVLLGTSLSSEDDSLYKVDSYHPMNRMYSEFNLEGQNQDKVDESSNQGDEKSHSSGCEDNQDQSSYDSNHMEK